MHKHAFDITAFVWGVMSIAAAALFALDDAGSLQLDLKWLIPAALVASGIIGIANALRSLRR